MQLLIIADEISQYLITPEGIHLDPSKEQSISTIPLPKTVKDLIRLLGIVNFYHRFLPKTGHHNSILYAPHSVINVNLTCGTSFTKMRP